MFILYLRWKLYKGDNKIMKKVLDLKELLRSKGLLAELEDCRNEEEAINVLKRENLWGGVVNYPELEELKESYKNSETEADGMLSLSQLDKVAGGAPGGMQAKEKKARLSNEFPSHTKKQNSTGIPRIVSTLDLEIGSHDIRNANDVDLAGLKAAWEASLEEDEGKQEKTVEEDVIQPEQNEQDKDEGVEVKEEETPAGQNKQDKDEGVEGKKEISAEKYMEECRVAAQKILSDFESDAKETVRQPEDFFFKQTRNLTGPQLIHAERIFKRVKDITSSLASDIYDNYEYCLQDFVKLVYYHEKTKKIGFRFAVARIFRSKKFRESVLFTKKQEFNLKLKTKYHKGGVKATNKFGSSYDSDWLWEYLLYQLVFSKLYVQNDHLKKFYTMNSEYLCKCVKMALSRRAGELKYSIDHKLKGSTIEEYEEERKKVIGCMNLLLDGYEFNSRSEYKSQKSTTEMPDLYKHLRF